MTQIVPPVTVEVTTPAVSEPLTPYIVAGLARELAMDLRDIDEILNLYKVSRAAYEKLKASDFFEKLVDAAKIEWHSALNTTNRVQIEAASIVEQAMPVIYARMIDPKAPLQHAVDAGKWLSEIAGLKRVPGSGDPGERIKIEINLGADTKLTYDKSLAPVSGDPVVAAIPVLESDPAERV